MCAYNALLVTLGTRPRRIAYLDASRTLACEVLASSCFVLASIFPELFVALDPSYSVVRHWVVANHNDRLTSALALSRSRNGTLRTSWLAARRRR